MKIIGDIIRDTIADLGIQESIKKHQVLVDWHRLVGESVSKVTEPQRISRGRIFVKVKNDVWRHELHYQKKTIIDQINEGVGSQVVKEIIFI